MEERIISSRIDKPLHDRMKLHDEINWSAVIRKALIEKIRKTEKEREFDEKKAGEAAKAIDKIRESGVFDKGKSSTMIIREWKDKKK